MFGRVNVMQSFSFNSMWRTFQNKEPIYYNTMNCRAKVGGPDGLFEAN